MKTELEELIDAHPGQLLTYDDGDIYYPDADQHNDPVTVSTDAVRLIDEHFGGPDVVVEEFKTGELVNVYEKAFNKVLSLIVYNKIKSK